MSVGSSNGHSSDKWPRSLHSKQYWTVRSPHWCCQTSPLPEWPLCCSRLPSRLLQAMTRPRPATRIEPSAVISFVPPVSPFNSVRMQEYRSTTLPASAPKQVSPSVPSDQIKDHLERLPRQGAQMGLFSPAPTTAMGQTRRAAK